MDGHGLVRGWWPRRSKGEEEKKKKKKKKEEEKEEEEEDGKGGRVEGHVAGGRVVAGQARALHGHSWAELH